MGGMNLKHVQFQTYTNIPRQFYIYILTTSIDHITTLHGASVIGLAADERDLCPPAGAFSHLI